MLEVVHGVNNWKRLGLELGLHYQPTLINIETHRREKPDDCKMEMLSSWLNQWDSVSQEGDPSWPVLQAALRRMGENRIAGKIKCDSLLIVS